MCGISLIIQRAERQPDRDLLIRMSEKVIHRGPDDEGYFIEGKVGLGHRRLSIIDVSERGHQPMGRDDVWITYNGEIYNYLELKRELEDLGHAFVTSSDTEVILAGWKQWRKGLFERLNGMWAFVLYDIRAEKVTVCRDHFGIKPLYYTICGDQFLAASEIKQFTVFPEFEAILNEEVCYNFLVNGWLNYSEKTFFKGVHELKQGHYLEYDLSGQNYTIREWYDLQEKVRPVSDDFTTAKEKIYGLLTDSVRIRMRSDVRVGSCLSGGLDSSGIVSLIHKNQYANGSFATITSCYEDARFDERPYSDIVTRHTQYPGEQVFPDLDDLILKDHLDLMLYHQEQPINTASHYAEFKVFEQAASMGLKVMQDGQGADEYYWGYEEFFQALFQSKFSKLRLRSALNLLRVKASHNESSLKREAVLALLTNYFYPLVPVYKRAVNKPKVSWVDKRWQSKWGRTEYKLKAKDCQKLSLEQIRCSSLPYQLHSEDRNSMLFSIESRLPYLDPRLVEYVMSLPADFKIQNGYSKYILREVLKELPESIRYRKHKMGFPAPDREWIRNQSEFVRSELEQAIREIPFLNAELLGRYNKFVQGTLGYESIYFRVISLNRLIRIFQLKYEYN